MTRAGFGGPASDEHEPEPELSGGADADVGFGEKIFRACESSTRSFRDKV